jgi:sugar/nucleoside kinase (ribokinase family)
MDAYEALAERLAAGDPAPVEVATFPDGSVDTFCAVRVGSDEPVESRAEFARRVRGGESKSFRLAPTAVESGGQCVNMAQQAAALDERVTCYGHLDDPTFDDLGFDAVSMGRPAQVSICEFDDEDVVFSTESPDIVDWTAADVVATDPGPEPLLGADAVCCGNWVSFPNMADALTDLAGRAPDDGGVFVLDPGDVRGSSRGAVESLLDSLGSLDGPYDATLSVNGGELDAVGDAIDAPADDAGRLTAIRERAGVSAAVLHDRDEAVAATRSSVVGVTNHDVEERTRQTGGGDRFTLGLAVARARGWSWTESLALANTVASHYIDHGRTADWDAVERYVRERTDATSNGG